MKKLFSAVLVALSCAVSHAEQTKTTFNPFTGKPDYITALSTNSVQAGSGVTVSTTSLGVTISASGGGGITGSVLSSTPSNVAVYSATTTLTGFNTLTFGLGNGGGLGINTNFPNSALANSSANDVSDVAGNGIFSNIAGSILWDMNLAGTTYTTAFDNRHTGAGQGVLLLEGADTTSSSNLLEVENGFPSSKVAVFSVKGNGNIGIGNYGPTQKLTLSSGTFLMDGTTQKIQISSGSEVITSTGPSSALILTANGTYGTTIGSSGGFFENCTGGQSATGMCMQLYSNGGAQSNLAGMLNIINDSSTWNQPSLYILHTNNVNNNSDILVDDAFTPAITLRETVQTNPSAKKWQYSAHNGVMRFEDRANDDSGFIPYMQVSSITFWNDVYVGPTYGNQSNFTQFGVQSSTGNTYALTLTTSASNSTPYLLSVTTSGVTNLQGLTVASMTLTGVGNPSFTSADGNTYQFVGSSTVPTNTHLAVWSSSNAIIDGGVVPSGGGVTVPSSFTWTGVTVSSNITIGGANPILSTSTLQAGSTIYVASGTISGPLSISSATTHNGNVIFSSTVILSNGAGTNGQAFTSGGPGTIPSWTTISGSGGGVSVPSTFTWAGVTLSSNVTIGGANPILSTTTLQANTTIYVSSMTIKGPNGFNITDDQLGVPVTQFGNYENPLQTIYYNGVVASTPGMETEGMFIVLTDTDSNFSTNPLNDLVPLHTQASQFQNTNSQLISIWAEADGQSAWDPNITAIYAVPGWRSGLTTGTTSEIDGLIIYPTVSDLTGTVFKATGTAIGIHIPAFTHGTGAPGQNWPIWIGDRHPSFFAGPIGIQQQNPNAAFEIGTDSTQVYAMIIGTIPYQSWGTVITTSAYIFDISTQGVINSRGSHNFFNTFVSQSSAAISGNLDMGVATTTLISSQFVISATPTLTYAMVIGSGPSVVDGTMGTDKYVVTVATNGFSHFYQTVTVDNNVNVGNALAVTGTSNLTGNTTMVGSVTVSGAESSIALNGGTSGTAGTDIQSPIVSGTGFMRSIFSNNAVWSTNNGNWTLGNNFGNDMDAMYMTGGYIGFTTLNNQTLPTTLTNAQFLAASVMRIDPGPGGAGGGGGGVNIGNNNQPTTGLSVVASSGANVTYGLTVGTLTANAMNITATSATVIGASGANVQYGLTVASFTVYTTTVTTSDIILKSTSNVTIFSVSNSTVGANDFMLTIASSNPGATLMSVDANGNEILAGSATVTYGLSVATVTVSSYITLSPVANPGGASTGTLWTDSRYDTTMSSNVLGPKWAEWMVYSTTASTTTANTVTGSTVTLNAVGTVGGVAHIGNSMLPANYLTAGKRFEVIAEGYYSNTGTPTLRFFLNIGTFTVCDTTARTTPTLAASNDPFHIRFEVQTQVAGGNLAGKEVCSGSVMVSTGAANLSGNSDEWLAPNTSQTTIDTTIANGINLVGVWGTASASNSFTFTDVYIKEMF